MCGASWCVACKQEHPLLLELARRKLVPIVGLNYKDPRDAALAVLKADGNPYDVSLVDADGRVGIDWLSGQPLHRTNAQSHV